MCTQMNVYVPSIRPLSQADKEGEGEGRECTREAPRLLLYSKSAEDEGTRNYHVRRTLMEDAHELSSTHLW